MAKITDQFGNPISSTPPKSDAPSAAVSINASSLGMQMPMTPYSLATALRQTNGGNMAAAMNIYREIEEKDPHLFSVLQKRRISVSGLDWAIEKNGDDKKAEDVAAFVLKIINDLPDFEDNLFDLTDAIGKGYSAFQLTWQLKDSRHVVSSIKHVDAAAFIFPDGKGIPKILTKENQMKGEELGAWEYLFHIHKLRTTSPQRQGLFRLLTWSYLFKNYSMKDWVVFCETYGMPLRIGKYAQGSTEADRETLEQAVRYMGTDAAAVISDSTQIDFVTSEIKTGSSTVYEQLNRFCDEQMSKAILGHSASVDATPGQLGNDTSSREVSYDILKFDCEQISKAIRQSIIRPLVIFNFGDGTPLPWMRLQYKPPEDDKTKAELYGMHIKNGAKIPAKHYREVFNLPTPDAGEELLGGTMPAASAVASFASSLLVNSPATSVAPSELSPVEDLSNRLQAVASFDGLLLLIREMLDASPNLESFQQSLADVAASPAGQSMATPIANALALMNLHGRFEVQGGE